MSASRIKVPYTFKAPPRGWIEKLPDGDYTVGRGADPRSADERASTRGTTKKRPKRRSPRPREAAE
jgi:hypothetical protein